MFYDHFRFQIRINSLENGHTSKLVGKSNFLLISTWVRVEFDSLAG